MVYDCVDDVSEDKRPGSSQAVLHLSEQQRDKQVIHEQNAVAFIAVGRLLCPFTHRQQNSLDRKLQEAGDSIKVATSAEHTKTVQIIMRNKDIALMYSINEISHWSF